MAEEGSPGSPPDRAHRLRQARIAIFSVLLVAMLVGPIKLQLIDDPESARPAGTGWYRGWRMFRGIGLGFIQVEATVALPGGSSRPLTNDELFGEAERSPEKRRIKSGDRVPAALGSSCARLPQGARVEGRWRRATRTGWTKWQTAEPIPCPAGGR